MARRNLESEDEAQRAEADCILSYLIGIQHPKQACFSAYGSSREYDICKMRSRTTRAPKYKHEKKY